MHAASKIEPEAADRLSEERRKGTEAVGYLLRAAYIASLLLP
jgi:hypothetical protein